MDNYQSFSYRLLYEMEPMFISSLHINNESSDRVVWENFGIADFRTLMNAVFKIFKIG